MDIMDYYTRCLHSVSVSMKTVNTINNNDGVHEISLYNVSGSRSNVKFSNCFKRKYIVIYKENQAVYRNSLGG